MDAFTENLLLAEREEMRNERKMVLELRTERGFPLGCDGSARGQRYDIGDFLDRPYRMRSFIAR